MFIHLLDSLLILLDDKMTLDLHGGSELSPSKAEVVRDYDELVNLNTKDIWINNHPHSQSFSIYLGSIGHSLPIHFLDGSHDEGFNLGVILFNNILSRLSFNTQVLGPLQ